MEGAGRHRNVRRPPLGEGIFRSQQERPRHRPPEQARRSVDRPERDHRSIAGPRHPAAHPAALHRHSAPPRRRDPRRLSEGDHGIRVRRRLLLHLPDQGQPAAARRRGDPRLWQGLPLRAGGRLQARVAGRAGPDQRAGHADHLQRLQGRRIHPHDHAGPQDRQADHPRRREVHGAGADPAPRRGPARPAVDRRAASSWRRAARAAGAPAPATVPSSV